MTPNIAVDEVLAELDRLKLQSEDRPAGYYTKADIAVAVLRSGKSSTINGAKSYAQRFIDEFQWRGVQLPKQRIRIVSDIGKVSFAWAYKIVGGGKRQ